MGETDDERWLEGVAGRRSAAAAAAPAEREAVRLRAAIHARATSAPPTASEIEAGLQALQRRLRRDGLLAVDRRARGWPALALAASVLVAVAAVALYRQGWPPSSEDEEAFAIRGGRVQPLVAADPARKADAIAEDLRALGMTVMRRDTRQASLVEALVQNRDDPRLAAVLARHGLDAGDGGPVLVRVTRSR